MFSPASFHRHSPLSGVLLRFSVLAQTGNRMSNVKFEYMNIYLNVRVTITDDGRRFTVWSRPHRYLPGIEFYTGMSDSLNGAIRSLEDVLPDSFAIDDEISIKTTSLNPIISRPFEIVKSGEVRLFCLS